MERSTILSEPQSSSINMKSTEEQIKSVLEENRGLKSYIENMNNECLELNAVLFDEANKMVIAARSKQHFAEKRAKEKMQENELLRSQVETLKAVITKLPSPIATTAYESDSNLAKSIHKKDSKYSHNTHSNRRPKKSEASAAPKVFHKSCEDFSLLMAASSEDVLTSVSKNALLNALLAETDGLEDKDRNAFQEFVAWFRGGCLLQYPFGQSTLDGDGKNGQEILTEGKRVVIIRPQKLNHSLESESDEKPVKSAEEHHSPDSTMKASSSNAGCAFLLRLYNDDIRPCLDFRDTYVQNAIYHALPELALEINPFAQLSKYRDTLVSDLKTACPLLPSLEPVYHLTVKNPNPSDLPSDEHIGVNISAEARHRIAAAVNLFQYLTYIARGISPIPRISEPERGSTSRRGSQLSELNFIQNEQLELIKHFRKIQRLRLAIAFARLGFGLPESD